MAVGESWLIFGLSLGLNLAAVYLVAIQLKLFLPEAMASAVQAWLLLAGNLLGFAALGASLPPLAALLQLPLALLPPVQQSGLSANLATAIAGALTCALLNLILAGWKLGRAWRYPAVALLASNPLLLFYSGAGSPDVPAVLFVVLSIHLFLLWLRHHESRPAIALASLISMGFSAGLASLARYEAAVYAVLLLALLWWQAGRTGPSHAGRVAALLITYAVPVISVLGAWAWLNLLVMNDPSSGPGYLAAGAGRGPDVSPITPSTWRYLFLAAPLILLPAGWLRSHLAGPGSQRRVTLPAGIVALLALALATVVSVTAIAQWAQPERASSPSARALPASGPTGRWAAEQEIALYLQEQANGHRVLLDDWEGYRVIFFTGRPKLFIAAGDPDFLPSLRSPQGRVAYILVRDPRLQGSRALDGYYPGIYQLGREWATLTREWPASGWHLYQVKAASE